MQVKYFFLLPKRVLALGILRNSENIQPKVWKELDVDPKRYVNIREYRDRTEGTQRSYVILKVF